ncbi:unnamed protein product [Allacma fusca]|uniref:BED-type domain-containing protein n=1 Tax=Allacma fusca TaxID=39272 RepID=A0A8J2P9R9_9HEXA|nr:unnamed protein product [Allacma fusca]
MDTSDSNENQEVVSIDVESENEGIQEKPPGPKRAKSCVYQHFTLSADNRYFKCRYCSSTLKKDPTGSTSGMRKHIQRIHKHIELNQPTDSKQQKMDSFLKKSDKQFDPEIFEDLLIRFIVATNQPFLVVNSKEFRAFASYSRNEVVIPKNDTLKSRCIARIVAITADNASNCGTLIDEFERLSNSQGSSSRTIIVCSQQSTESETCIDSQLEDSADEYSDSLGLSDDDYRYDVPAAHPQYSVYRKFGGRTTSMSIQMYPEWRGIFWQQMALAFLLSGLSPSDRIS